MTKDQKLALVEAWKASELPQWAFAAQHNISPHTFANWARGKSLASKKGRPAPGTKARYLKLRAEGMTAARASYACEINVATGKRWDAAHEAGGEA
jgi:hypothetical protein